MLIQPAVGETQIQPLPVDVRFQRRQGLPAAAAMQHDRQPQEYAQTLDRLRPLLGQMGEGVRGK